MEPLRPGEPAQVGPYPLVGRLGTGPLGEQYAGRGPDGRPVTVTLVMPQLAGDPVFRAVFRRDVAAARRVGGPFVLPVDADTESPAPWLATGVPEAPTLASAVAGSGPLPPHVLRDLAVALAGAMGAVLASGGALFGLEPAHVVLTPEGPRLAAYGVTGPARGPHAAPGGIRTEADAVYTLGALLHFAATGRPPAPAAGGWQQGPPPPVPVPDPVLGQAIAECLAPRAAGRPSLRGLVERLGGVGPGGVPAAGLIPRQRWWRTGAGQAAALVAVLALVTGVALATDGSGDDFGGKPAAQASAPGLPDLNGLLPSDKGPGADGSSTDGGDSGSDSGSSDGSSSGSGSSGGSDLPGDEPSADPIAAAAVGDCFTNSGTAASPQLAATYCGPQTFKAVAVLRGTTDTHQCDSVAEDDWNVSYPSRGVLLCLSYQYDHGTAYHAKNGTCVYGSSASSDWDQLDCQTGAFTVIARYTGTLSSDRCKSLRNDDWSEHFGVTGRTDLDVTLCLSMVYPDDAGHAVQNQCMKFTGTYAKPVMHAVSCAKANVIVTGRTSKYNDKKFCGNDAWTTWKPNDYPGLAYTMCYRQR
ncbi:LppU/SCO3897 family protein [Actinacidiphila epipremni]|uniref:Protein kinase domain-containing protein n=1 Tax=Actinacidiphila epipremni TaxID=2053013 RepID=A0ABX0ZL28_9ACTN|nr:hypothetical protein [Actinacidiphila epipremni]NJP44555.1 hypothetical protein [Actinacidiphila epipremni]